jgi:hypothetical protein
MRTFPLSRIAILAIATGLGALLFTPIASHAETPEYAPGPVAAPKWEEATGFDMVEIDLVTTALPAPDVDATWDSASGYGAVEAVRASMAAPAAVAAPGAISGVTPSHHVMGSGGLGSSPAETIALTAPVPTNVTIPTRHIMGSGGLGSPEVETVIVGQPVVIA